MNDLISRQEAIDAVAPFDTNHELRDTLESLPPVEPTLKNLKKPKNQAESQGERMTRIVHELSGCDAESATTTEDCISRQAAISIPILPKEERKKFKDYDDAFETGWLEALACVNMLPPVTPKPVEDCISREYILSFLDGEVMGDDDYIAGMNDEQREIREVVRNAPSVIPTERTGEWVPVSERLPEGYDQYLCCCEGGDCYVYWLDNEPWAEETVKKERIIAWMPLPEPYKGGDDND